MTMPVANYPVSVVCVVAVAGAVYPNSHILTVRCGPTIPVCVVVMIMITTLVLVHNSRMCA